MDFLQFLFLRSLLSLSSFVLFFRCPRLIASDTLQACQLEPCTLLLHLRITLPFCLSTKTKTMNVPSVSTVANLPFRRRVMKGRPPIQRRTDSWQHHSQYQQHTCMRHHSQWKAKRWVDRKNEAIRSRVKCSVSWVILFPCCSHELSISLSSFSPSQLNAVRYAKRKELGTWTLRVSYELHETVVPVSVRVSAHQTHLKVISSQPAITIRTPSRGLDFSLLPGTRPSLRAACLLLVVHL